MQQPLNCTGVRANQCRELAAAARDEYSRQTLSQMAVELDAEAEAIEAGDDPDVPIAHQGL